MKSLLVLAEIDKPFTIQGYYPAFWKIPPIDFYNEIPGLKNPGFGSIHLRQFGLPVVEFFRAPAFP